MFSLILFAFGTAVLLFGGECVVGPETRSGWLEVAATDLTGTRIPEVEVELVPLGRVGEALNTKSTRSRVLYGDYQIRVYAKGFSVGRRDVRIYQPELLIRIELGVGNIACPDPPADIGGRIKRDGGLGELWVKAVPLRGVGGGEARVSDSGYFLISGLEYSDYMLFVLQGEKLLHQEVVKTYPIGRSGAAKLAIDITNKR